MRPDGAEFSSWNERSSLETAPSPRRGLVAMPKARNLSDITDNEVFFLQRDNYCALKLEGPPRLSSNTEGYFFYELWNPRVAH